MTVELACLALNALWGFVLVFVEIYGKTRQAGPAWNAGNRANEPEFAAWVGRAGRALDNHKENFPLFFAGVVVVTLAGQADTISAVGAVTYAVARVLHGVIYIAGITGLRTAVWMVGTLGVLAIYLAIVL
ncbi:MAG: MAPEG family protein [Myxococcota bacterium]